ncbi:MAG: TonB-dependent receptor [Bacteroidaceae bacterium]|nr:TonB-dependent receptor [Bacteroidaceae bacterium]
MLAGTVSPMFAETATRQVVQLGDNKIQGIVVDENGEPLVGVTVRIKDTGTGTATDLDGRFAVNVEPGATLQVSYIGFLPQTVKVTGRPMHIILREDSKSLEDVVVVGYGSMKKKLVTGATVEIKGENIQKLNTTNPLLAMQGQTPGVTITSNSGQPGSSMSVQIRGLGTVGNASPLYVIDGIPGGDISTINPADIERIDVLKDAASEAIYGNNAANGVILVTTKSGKEGKAKISFDSYWGWQKVARQADLLNSSEYMTILDEAAVNSGKVPHDWNSYQSIKDANGNIYDTDWVNQMIKDNAQTSSYNLGITGGNAMTTYAFSLGYLNQEGVIGGSDVSDYSRYNARLNAEEKVIKNLLKVGQQISFVYGKTRGVGVGNQYNNSLRGAFATSPLAPVYDAAGNYNDTYGSDWNAHDGNPYGQMMTCNQAENKNFTFNGNLYAELEPIKNLKFRTVFSTTYSSSNNRSYTPTYRFSDYVSNTGIDKVSQSASDGFSLTWTNTAQYDWMIKDHAFSALLGMEMYRGDGISLNGSGGNLMSGYNYFERAYLSKAQSATSDDGLSVGGSPWEECYSAGYFLRLGWNWKERYMVNATIRRDGDARFADGHKWGTFPSVSGGWTISNEDFMDNTEDWLDFLKLRLSWGQVGNKNIAYYQYLSPVTSAYGSQSTGVQYVFGTEVGSAANVTGTYPSRLENQNVKWETSEQFDAGLDAKFLNNRLTVSLDYYVKTTRDWLVKAPIKNLPQDYAPYINGGDVKNTGVELALSWQDRIGNDFHYNIGFNGAYNKNEVGAIPTEDGIIHGDVNQLYDNSSEFARCENGHAIGYFWGYQTAGIFQNQQEINDWIAAGNGVLQGSKVAPGDVKFVDQNNDGVIDDKDKVDLGNGIPDFTYGFNLGFDYKGFDFSLVANGAAGMQIVQTYRNWASNEANYTKSILDRWTGEGTSNTIPRVLEDNSVNWAFSDLYIQDADYLRISNITLGYDFARLWKTKYVSQCRLYFQVQNAFTFTKYDGMDPEIGTLGSSNGWVSGVDVGYYPRPRTFLFGVNLKF